jgi:hypothetical protein
MDTNTPNQATPEPTENAEDAVLEQQALAEPKVEDFRAQVITDYGLDPAAEGHEELIQKLTNDKVEAHKKLSTAIRQKRDWREKAQKPAETAAKETPAISINKSPAVEDVSKLARTVIDEALDEEKLNEIELSDEGKIDLRTYAKSKGITARQALKTDYFTYLKDREGKVKREEEASVSRSTTVTSAKTNFSLDKPPAVDMSTEEGRKKYHEWYDWASKQNG